VIQLMILMMIAMLMTTVRTTRILVWILVMASAR
jgi:hypothetical protein